ncbi:MAG: hypothetical protein JW768_06800 [Chitinispirillaceae bacterium]|nr:hypothetical protein [Chitinispirillaceae bacterium]
MKTIVVSGARSKVGKTTLARAVCGLLPGAVRIKIGHGSRKQGVDGYFYSLGTPFDVIASEHAEARYLVIESNRVLEEMAPDCTIYLGADNPKPSAKLAMERADIRRGEPLQGCRAAELASRLGCDITVIHAIIKLAGAIEGSR